MPIYTFDLRDGSSVTSDREGIALPDRDRAFAYATDVIRELLLGNETEARQWRLDVYEDGADRVFSIPFAGFDSSLDHLSPAGRSTVESHYNRIRALREAMSAVRATVQESRALVALSRGKPYLAAVRGVRTIRA